MKNFNAILNTAKKTVYSACLYYTALEFAILLLVNAFGNKAASVFLTLEAAGMLLLGSFIAALAKLVFSFKLPLIVKLLVHFAGAYLGLFTGFMLPADAYNNPRTLTVFTIAYAVIYVVIALIALMIKNIARSGGEDEEYENKFGSTAK